MKHRDASEPTTSAATAAVVAFVEAAAPDVAAAVATATVRGVAAARRPASAVPAAIRELIEATASVFKPKGWTSDQMAGRQFDDRFLEQNGGSETSLDPNGDSDPSGAAAVPGNSVLAAAIAGSNEADLAAAIAGSNEADLAAAIAGSNEADLAAAIAGSNEADLAAAIAGSSEADLAAAGAELAAAGNDDEWDDSAGAGVPAVSRKVKPRLRTRRTRMRSRTIALKRLTRVELQRGAIANPPVEDVDRPTTRSDCRDAPRPCPWVACKHHLYLDINPRTGSIKINFPDLEPWELQHTCALDVADNGGLTLEEIGLITNLTRERVRQLEVRGLLTLRTRSNSLR